MIQATNELLLGIELNEQYAQITYFHQSVREPVTLENLALPGQMQFSAALGKDASGSWQFLDEAASEEKDRILLEDIYGKILRQEEISSQGEVYEPVEALAIYFAACLAQLKLLTQNTQVQIMVTVKELTEALGRVIVDALMKNGIDRKQIYVQDYLSSFYYYTVNQRKELWYQDVALLTFEEETIVGYVLHIDRKTKPALAQVVRAASQPMDEAVCAGRSAQEWKKEKDRLFFELLKKVFERRNVSVCYLLGDYFSKEWAVRSIQYLCYKRHAFQGQNLYSKGACYAAMERAGLIADRGILFRGRDMVTVNLGMEMCIRGKETYYPLVNAGVNWYEVHHVCEFIPNGERELRFVSRTMTGGSPVIHEMRLPNCPKRPNRATRLRLTVYFSAPGCCHIEVEDRGFGGLYKSSNLTWKREIFF